MSFTARLAFSLFMLGMVMQLLGLGNITLTEVNFAGIVTIICILADKPKSL